MLRKNQKNPSALVRRQFHPFQAPAASQPVAQEEMTLFRVIFTQGPAVVAPPADMLQTERKLREKIAELLPDVNLSTTPFFSLSRDGLTTPQVEIAASIALQMPSSLSLKGVDGASMEAILFSVDLDVTECALIHADYPVRGIEATGPACGQLSQAPASLLQAIQEASGVLIHWALGASSKEAAEENIRVDTVCAYTAVLPNGSGLPKNHFVHPESRAGMCSYCRHVGHTRPDCPVAPACTVCESTRHSVLRCPNSGKTPACPQPKPVVASVVRKVSMRTTTYVPASLPQTRPWDLGSTSRVSRPEGESDKPTASTSTSSGATETNSKETSRVQPSTPVGTQEDGQGQEHESPPARRKTSEKPTAKRSLFQQLMKSVEDYHDDSDVTTSPQTSCP